MMTTARRFKLERLRIHFINKCHLLAFIAIVIAFECLWLTSKSINVTANKSYIHVCSPLNFEQFEVAIFILDKYLTNLFSIVAVMLGILYCVQIAAQVVDSTLCSLWNLHLDHQVYFKYSIIMTDFLAMLSSVTICNFHENPDSIAMKLKRWIYYQVCLARQLCGASQSQHFACWLWWFLEPCDMPNLPCT